MTDKSGSGLLESVKKENGTLFSKYGVSSVYKWLLLFIQAAEAIGEPQRDRKSPKKSIQITPVVLQMQPHF